MKLISKVLLTLAVLMSFNAHATDIITNIGNISVPSSTAYSNNHSGSEQNTNFFDDFTFSLTGASANSVTSSISLDSFLGISGLSARLYSGNTHETGPSSGITNLLLENWGTTISLGGGVNQTTVVLNPLVLAAGTYTLQIKGLVTGLAGGSYAGVLNVAPVPEPDTNVMLLSGLLLIGFIATKKRNNA